jgi:hypothetical protein
MKKNIKQILLLLIIMPCLLFASCGVINVGGKTFTYSKVSIDWGLAKNEDKEIIFKEYQVSSETELLNVLKTQNNRNSRFTTFGTDGKYVTKNTENEILDSGYYRQDETVITLADTEEELNQAGAYTIQANEKGYVVTVKINDEFKVFAKYQYVEQN